MARSEPALVSDDCRNALGMIGRMDNYVLQLARMSREFSKKKEGLKGALDQEDADELLVYQNMDKMYTLIQALQTLLEDTVGTDALHAQVLLQVADMDSTEA